MEREQTRISGVKKTREIVKSTTGKKKNWFLELEIFYRNRSKAITLFGPGPTLAKQCQRDIQDILCLVQLTLTPRTLWQLRMSDVRWKRDNCETCSDPWNAHTRQLASSVSFIFKNDFLFKMNILQTFKSLESEKWFSHVSIFLSPLSRRNQSDFNKSTSWKRVNYMVSMIHFLSIGESEAPFLVLKFLLLFCKSHKHTHGTAFQRWSHIIAITLNGSRDYLSSSSSSHAREIIRYQWKKSVVKSISTSSEIAGFHSLIAFSHTLFFLFAILHFFVRSL